MAYRGAWALRRVGLGVSALLLAVALVHFVNVSYDDVFISFRYAENLAAGRGLVFNPNERVEGFSNFAWTMLLAVPALLGAAKHELGMLIVAKALGAAAGLSTLWLVALSRDGAERSRAAAWPLGATYLSLTAPFGAWAGAGMETSVVGLLLVAFVVLDERERRRGFDGPSWSFGVLCLAALTRPEPVLLLPALLALRATEVARERRWVTVLRAGATFGLPYAAFLAFRLGYYGELVPNTYFAKRALDSEAWARGWEYLVEGNRELGLTWVVGASCGVLLLARTWSRSTTVVVAMLFVHLASVVYEGGDWMLACRLLVPALPLVAVLVERAWASGQRASWRGLQLGAAPAWVMPPRWVQRYDDWLEKVRRLPLVGRDRVVAMGALGVLIASLGTSCLSSWAPWVGSSGSGFAGVNLRRGPNFEIAFWLREHMTRSGLLATGEAGVIPYYTRLPLLDLYGLMDRHIARQSGARHRKFDVDYVLGRRPLYFVLPAQRGEGGQVIGSTPYSQSLLNQPAFLRDYALMNELAGARVYRRAAP